MIQLYIADTSETVGIGQVIKGWDEGLQGMCLNEKRTITIPAAKAYGAYLSPKKAVMLYNWLTFGCLGDRGFPGAIPPNSALVFTVELVGLTPSEGRDEL